MRRVQIHLEEDVDRAAAAEAARRGISKAALIREGLDKELETRPEGLDPAWSAMIGWISDDQRPTESIDDTLYGRIGQE